MGYVSFHRVKQAVRADDFNDDDEYLMFLTEAAEEHVIKRIRRQPNEIMDNGVLPLPLQQAILLLVGHWYNQREAVASAQLADVPLGFEALVRPFIKLSDKEDK